MIILDNREIKLIELIKSYPGGLKIPYQIQNLLIGDITITHQIQKTNTPLTIKPDETAISPEIKYTIIIERKTVCDMIASIKDGRYKEQKIRLKAEQQNNSNGNNHIMIIYILEGSNDEARNPQDRTMLNGAVISCNFRDKITILRTFNLTETLKLIIRLCDRLIKDPSDIFQDKQINTLNQLDSNIETGNIQNDNTQHDNTQHDNTYKIGRAHV